MDFLGRQYGWGFQLQTYEWLIHHYLQKVGDSIQPMRGRPCIEILKSDVIGRKRIPEAKCSAAVRRAFRRSPLIRSGTSTGLRRALNGHLRPRYWYGRPQRADVVGHQASYDCRARSDEQRTRSKSALIDDPWFVQWTGIVADGKRCHTNKVACHTDLEKRFANFLDDAKDVLRYFKNERLGFSVTYYESNRPRQYFPDFIIVARDGEGREVMWVAETKGEVRPNTALKSEAARLWCEKMSGTKYGQWRYLFLQQRKLEDALARGVTSLRELADVLAVGRPAAQLKLVPIEDATVRSERFKTLLPLYSLKAAAGYFGNSEAVEPEGWVEASSVGKLDASMFVCRAVGRSMEPE